MKNTYLDEICDVIAKVKTKVELLSLLRDLLTPHELKSLAERWQIFKQLSTGVPQRRIAETLKVSIAKVERGSKALKKNHGGVTKSLKA